MSLIVRVHNTCIGNIFQSNVNVIYFCRGFSCCPYYRGVCNSEVSARQELTVITDRLQRFHLKLTDDKDENAVSQPEKKLQQKLTNMYLLQAKLTMTT